MNFIFKNRIIFWNCGCTIFLAQILLIRPWSKAQPTINICRGWVKELSLSEPIRSDTWTILLQKNKNTRMDLSRLILFLQFLIPFFRPFLWGTPLHYIVLLLSSQPYTCWPSKHLLEHLSHQPPSSLPLWVAEAKVVLFRGLFLINAAKWVVGAHLMWW